MFEQSLIQSQPVRKRGWVFLLSSLGEVMLLAVFCVVPVLRPEALPAVMRNVLRVGPPAGPAPHRPAGTVPSSGRQARQWSGRALVVPVARLTPVAFIVDELPGEEAGIGVVGGTGEVGQSDGVLKSLIGTSTPIAFPPPVRPVVREATSAAIVAKPIAVSRGVQEAKLLERTQPIYPRLALQTRTSGRVLFTAVIGKDGAIQNLALVSGHPLLIEAAAEAVRRWRYSPTLLSGQPVEVVTQIEVNFRIN